MTGKRIIVDGGFIDCKGRFKQLVSDLKYGYDAPKNNTMVCVVECAARRIHGEECDCGRFNMRLAMEDIAYMEKL